MASIQKHPRSRFYIAHYTDKQGRRRNKSTKLEAIPANRRNAQKIADSFEEAYRTQTVLATLRGNYTDIAKELNRAWGIPTVEIYLDSWLAMHSPTLADNSILKYTARIKHFKQFLHENERGAYRVDELMDEDQTILEYRNKLIESVSPTTVQNAMHILAFIFSWGLTRGYYFENRFATHVKIATKGTATEKRGFTLDEMKLVLEKCNPEWRSMCIFGLYTGQRIGDLARLTWNQIDVERGNIAFITTKTKRRMAIPIAAPLRAHIRTLRKGTPGAPVHPEAHRIINGPSQASSLSRQFKDILRSCNLAPARERSENRPPEAPRKRLAMNPLSFHSWRHSASTLLRMTGASEAVSREIIGHDSVSVDREYVHMDASAMQAALDKLPDITSA